ncbi:hypothetical protein PENTCL1PPCAC_19348, partial [Pristionchus entomophagus]
AMLGHLSQCIGRRIEHTVFISDYGTQSDFEALSELLGTTQFGELRITIARLSDEVADQLLSEIERHNVLKLTLLVREVTCSNPASMLIKLSSHVQSLHIDQPHLCGKQQKKKQQRKKNNNLCRF